MSANDQQDKKIRSAKALWEKANQRFFGRERKKEFCTEDGIPISRLYTPLDLLDQKYDYINSLGFPGEYPFTRGINPTGYRERIWACGQYAGSSSVEESNRLFKDLIAGGE